MMQVKVWSYFVEMCDKCGGIWLDRGNFGDFVRGLAASENIPNDVVELFKVRDVLVPHKFAEKARVCPRCNKELRKFNYSYDSNVILDKCPDCAGIWADKGEVEKAATYLKGDPRADTVARGLAELGKRDYPDSEDYFNRDGRIGAPGVVIPWSDDTERKRFPLVTVLIIAVCSAVFIGYVCLDSAGFMERFGLGSADSDGPEFFSWTYLSSGPLFFVFSMLFLWLFGDNVEDRFSRLGYLIFFGCSAILTGIVGALFKGDLLVTTVAVSGAVSSIMGAYFIFYPTANLKVFVFYETIEVPALLFLGLWLLLQMISPFVFKGSSYLNTAWAAHVSGFVFGMVIAHSMKDKAGESEKN